MTRLIPSYSFIPFLRVSFTKIWSVSAGKFASLSPYQFGGTPNWELTNQ